MQKEYPAKESSGFYSKYSPRESSVPSAEIGFVRERVRRQWENLCSQLKQRTPKRASCVRAMKTDSPLVLPYRERETR